MKLQVLESVTFRCHVISREVQAELYLDERGARCGECTGRHVCVPWKESGAGWSCGGGVPKVCPVPFFAPIARRELPDVMPDPETADRVIVKSC